MNFKSVILTTVTVLATVTSAHANVISFNLPSGVEFLPNSTYTQDGFTFQNSYGATGGYGNWIALGVPSYNANGEVADIFQNYQGTSNTITENDGNPFSFQSIGLADVYNYGNGGDIEFTFNYAAGGSTTETVSLASGILGLQTFNFNQSGLSSVVFTPTTTEGPWIQFDNVGVNGSSGAVPEPATWAMMLLGFGMVGFAMRKRTNIRTTVTYA
jgi:hypothetical protein